MNTCWRHSCSYLFPSHIESWIGLHQREIIVATHQHLKLLFFAGKNCFILQKFMQDKWMHYLKMHFPLFFFLVISWFVKKSLLCFFSSLLKSSLRFIAFILMESPLKNDWYIYVVSNGLTLFATRFASTSIRIQPWNIYNFLVFSDQKSWSGWIDWLEWYVPPQYGLDKEDQSWWWHVFCQIEKKETKTKLMKYKKIKSFASPFAT